MVFITDGYSIIGAHVRSNLCYLICLRLLISSRAVTNKAANASNREVKDKENKVRKIGIEKENNK